MNASLQESAAHYDAVPYESHPYWQSSPDLLGAVAVLFGLRCASPATARVLELGCAAGGNLIPHAARNPDAEYVGIDYSRVQIEAGQERIARLGLGNIVLHHASIDALPEGLGTFDYIIVHGVYSWVAPAIQDAILRACKEYLRPAGVAYVSYNVYPGWKTREIMRDAMLFHTRQLADPGERLGHAKGMVEYMQQIARPGSMFQQVVDAEAGAVATGSDAYLTHEYLEEHNRPCYFREFAGQALQHGLSYLGDGMLASMFPANLGEDATQRLNNVAHNQVDLEQYMDFLNNRVFRQTLLVHAAAEEHMRRDLGHEQLRQLAFYAGFHAQTDEQGTTVTPPTWLGLWGGTLQPGTALQHWLVDRFHAAYPGSLDAATLESEARAAAIRDGQSPEAAEQELYMVLRALVARGMVRIRARALVADWLARQDAAQGRAVTTGPLHEPTALNIVEQLILPLLDGTHARAALIDHLVAAERQERVLFRDHQQQRLTTEDAIRACAAEHLELALQTLAGRGLLSA